MKNNFKRNVDLCNCYTMKVQNLYKTPHALFCLITLVLSKLCKIISGLKMDFIFKN